MAEAETEAEHVNSMHRHRVTEMFDIVVDDNQRRNWEALRCQDHAVAVAVAAAAASHTAQHRSTPFPSHHPTCSYHPTQPYRQTRASQQHPYRSYRNTNTSRHVRYTH